MIEEIRARDIPLDAELLAELFVLVDDEIEAKLEAWGLTTAERFAGSRPPDLTKVSLLTLNVCFHVGLCCFATLPV